MKNNYLDIDTEIKNMLNEDIEVPDIVNEKSMEAYSMLRDIHAKEKSKKRKLKYIGASAAASILLLCSIGIYNPSLASGVPILENIFKDLNEKFIINKRYIDNSQPIKLVSNNNGIKIGINEAIFDGMNLYLTMEIKSETDSPLPRIDDYIWEDGSYQYVMYDESIKLDFDGKMNNSSGIIGYFKDDNTFVGVSHFELDTNKELPKSLNIDLKIGSIGEVTMDPKDFMDGSWEFNFNVNSDDSTKTYTPNLSKGEYKINELRVSPYGLILDYSMPCEFLDIKDGLINMTVQDDKGNELIGVQYEQTNLEYYDFKSSSDIINEKVASNIYVRDNIDLKNAEYLIVKFKDGKYEIVDDTITVSEDGNTIEGPSYKGIEVPETEDIEFKIKLK